MTFDFHPEAGSEFEDAAEFYERAERGLGEEFSLEVHAAIRNILAYPRAWPILESDVHRCLINRFPYGILYSIEVDRIYILAVMHLHRRPDYWKQRQ